jgi:putative membrane protein
MANGLSLTWHWSPGTILFLLVLCLLYVFCLIRTGTGNSQGAPIKAYHVVSFFSAIVLMALLLLTPIDTIARTQLFSVHMAQAVILTTLCAPLVLFGCPAILLRPFVNLPIVRVLIRVFTRPLVASVTFNLLFLLWHTPRLYHFALVHGTLYHVEMLSIFLASLLNWWPLIGSVPELRRMSYPMQMLYAFFDGQPVDIFAFLLVFSGTVIYPYYAVPLQLGILPFPDQTVAGALLLIPGIVDLVVMSPLFVRWLGQIEQQTKLDDQKRQEQARAEEAEMYEEIEVEEEETSEA